MLDFAAVCSFHIPYRIPTITRHHISKATSRTFIASCLTFPSHSEVSNCTQKLHQKEQPGNPDTHPPPASRHLRPDSLRFSSFHPSHTRTPNGHRNGKQPPPHSAEKTIQRLSSRAGEPYIYFPLCCLSYEDGGAEVRRSLQRKKLT